MLKIKNSSKFKRDLKKYRHEKSLAKDMNTFLSLLIRNESLPKKYRDHRLEGKWSKHRECHIKPDILLINFLDEEYLYLERLGSHSDLF